MRQINLENTQPGMVLAKDLYDRNGRLILKEGTSITEQHLRTFKVWRITALFVHMTGEQEKVEEERIDPDVQKRVDFKLKQKFRNADLSHPFMDMLYQNCQLRALAAALKSEKPHGT